MAETNFKTIAENRRAYHDYFVEEKMEAGISLFGTEVKSLRTGQVNLKDSYCTFENGEMLVVGMHVSPYEKGNIFNKDPLRKRVLLMHKKELRRLFDLVKKDNYTLVPISLYFKGSLVKMCVGLCKGKKLHDKRDSVAARDGKREIDRAMKERSRF